MGESGTGAALSGGVWCGCAGSSARQCGLCPAEPPSLSMEQGGCSLVLCAGKPCKASASSGGAACMSPEQAGAL